MDFKVNLTVQVTITCFCFKKKQQNAILKILTEIIYL